MKRLRKKQTCCTRKSVQKICGAKCCRCCLKQVTRGSHSKTYVTLRSPQQHVGVVHSSNLCTEITLNTSKDEIAVCNLGSINLVQHVQGGVLDREKLARTLKLRFVCSIT